MASKFRMAVFQAMLYLCAANDLMSSETFVPTLDNEGNRIECISGEYDQEFEEVRSEIQCSALCSKNNGSAYNYYTATKRCKIFDDLPPILVGVGNNTECRTKQVLSLDPSVCPISGTNTTIVPPYCCAFSLLFDEQLNYTHGDPPWCYPTGDQWVRCEQPMDYHDWGVFNIFIPTYPNQIPVMSVNRWIIFHHRLSPYTDFNQSWSEYVDGFGSSDSNYWMGLEKIYQLTKTGQWRMRLDAYIFELLQEVVFNEYASFYIDPSSDNYALHVSGWSGTYEDVLNKTYSPNSRIGQSNGSPFNTYDHVTEDHGVQCKDLSMYGGWWFSAVPNSCNDSCYCYTTNLNSAKSASGFGQYVSINNVYNLEPGRYFPMLEARMMLQLA